MNELRKYNKLSTLKNINYSGRQTMRTGTLLLVASLVMLSMPLFSDNISDAELNTFTGGTTALASEVNANFDVIQAAVNDNDTRISSLEATGGITSAHILDGTVTGTDIAANTITAADIAAGGVASSEIADGTVTGTDIATDTITAANIAAGGVGSSEIVDGSVTATDLASNSVYSAEIANNSIYDYDIVDEPGAEYSYSTSISSPSTSVTTIRSIAVTAPTTGYVLVILSGSTTFFKQNTVIYFDINTTTSLTSYDVSAGWLDGSSTNRFSLPFSVVRVFSVGTGTTTFYGLAQKSSTFGSGSCNVYNVSMSAIFVPTRY